MSVTARRLNSPLRLVLLEASKVRYQHSTFIDGLIRAWEAQGLSARHGRPKLFAHDSLFASLSAESRAAVDHLPVAVMDPEKRRLLRKSLLEAWVVLRRLAGLAPDEVLVVTTILPSAAILVEIGKWLFPRKRLVIFHHGEIEGALEGGKKGLGSFGVYVRGWLTLRRASNSRIRIASTDHFIATGIERTFPDSFASGPPFAIPIPMIAANRNGVLPGEGKLRVCFIGYDTPNKGFATFARLAAALPDYDFRVIGGGVDRSLSDGSEAPVTGNDAFLAAIARCHIAVFPYTAGYRLALSAAATDAIAAGLHLLTSDRPCFAALAEALGPDTVTVCDEESGIEARLRDRQWVDRHLGGRAARIARIDNSPYGLANVGRAIDAMMTDMADAPLPT